jgi:hypothetical protein
MQLKVSYAQFKDASQVIQFAVCHWNIEDFWNVLFEHKDFHGDTHDNKYVTKQFKEWSKNPFEYIMSMDVVMREHFFDTSKEQLNKALKVAS